MVAGAQNLRHRQPVPVVGPRVLRVLEKAGPVALVGEADLISQHARDQARDGVDDRHGRDLAAREHEIAHGDLFVDTFVEKALVHALIVAADEDEIVIVRLRRAAGGEEDGMHRRADLIADRAPAAPQRVTLHDRAAAAAVGVIVHLVLLVGGIVPDLVGVDLDEPLFLRPAEDAGVQHRRHGLRKQRHDIKTHGLTSLR